MFRSAFLTLVAIVGCASAQLNLNGLSSDCQSVVTNIIANPAAADCLGASSLLAISAAAATSSSSLISPIDNWLTNICSAPECSNATIASVFQNITDGCASDLNITAGAAPIASLTSTVEQLYPIVLEILCFKDGSTNCITQLLDNIQTTYGTITISNLLNLVGNFNASSIPPNITCTNCNKAIFNELNQPSLSFLDASDFKPVLESQCGASFIDGTTPSGIIESASNSTETASSSVSSAAFSGVSPLFHGIFTGLVVISGLFTLLP